MFTAAISYAQTIRGEVVDALTGEPLIGAHVSLKSDTITRNTITDVDGKFAFERLPIRRYTVEAQYLGFDPVAETDLAVSTAKETVVKLEMNENQNQLAEVVIKPKVKKESPLNSMMLTGGKMLSVDEASRFAGAFDDPARMVNSFAGVSSTGTHNSLEVHGNAPHMVQYRIEGVEVPAFNHMNDAYVLGGGVISALSSQVTGNSDFAYSAFPAEYGNALSGVLDMNLRNGNNTNYEHSLGVGLLGLEAQSEGPIGKGGASYLFNYRYSLLGLTNDMGIDAGGYLLDYQDLNFVVNMPTSKIGTFKLFGTAWQDHASYKIYDPKEWETVEDHNNSDVKQLSGIFGLSHRKAINKGSIKTTIATAIQNTKVFNETMLPEGYNYNPASSVQPINSMLDYIDDPNTTWVMAPDSKLDRKIFDITFSSVYQQRFSANVLFKGGVNLVNHDFSVKMHSADNSSASNTLADLKERYNADFNIFLAEAFAAVNVNIGPRLLLNTGAFALWNTDNGKTAIDPRISLRYDLGDPGTISMGYGLHSMMERMDAMSVVKDGKLVNRDLDFVKSHQVILSYDKKLGECHNLKVDLFGQYHFNVAVGAGEDADFSMLNLYDLFVDYDLVNDGKGRSYGVDVSLERYFTDGLYWMLNGSLFKAEYANADGIWHRSLYDRTWLVKALIGKEWYLGQNKNHVLNVSAKASLIGGMRYSPVIEDLSNETSEAIYDDKLHPFENQLDPAFNFDLTVSYKINRHKVSHEVGLKWINLTMQGSYIGHYYNYREGNFKPCYVAYTFPNYIIASTSKFAPL